MSGESAGPRVLFRCDASNQIGGGHAMRCLTLANALSEAGAMVTFVAATLPDALAQRIKDGGHRLLCIPASPELQRPDGKWEEPPFSDAAQLADAKATGAAVGQVDWLVVDHYLLDARWHSEARSFAGCILVIDDLANRNYDCDILLDQTFGRLAEDYRDRVPSGARILAGSAYALLRPEFARERPASLERRQAGGPVRRILITMGTTDPGGITASIVEKVIDAAPDCAIDVVLGSQARSLDKVRELAARHERISVHVDSDKMAELMRDADLAVGAAGSTSWERCCLGLPSITVILAENQSLIARRLVDAGAHISTPITNEQSLPEQALSLLESSEIRTRMAKCAARITDGLGSTRVCVAMDLNFACEIPHG